MAQPDHSGSCHEEHGICIRDAQFQNCKLQTFGHVFNTSERKMHNTAIISWLEKCSWVKSLRVSIKNDWKGFRTELIRMPNLILFVCMRAVQNWSAPNWMGKKGVCQRQSINKFKCKTLAQLHKGSMVWYYIADKLQLGILITAVMTRSFWKKMSFLRQALYRTSLF